MLDIWLYDQGLAQGTKYTIAAATHSMTGRLASTRPAVGCLHPRQGAIDYAMQVDRQPRADGAATKSFAIVRLNEDRGITGQGQPGSTPSTCQPETSVIDSALERFHPGRGYLQGASSDCRDACSILRYGMYALRLKVKRPVGCFQIRMR